MTHGSGVSRGDRNAVITTGQAWDPAIAAHGTGPKQTATLAA